MIAPLCIGSQLAVECFIYSLVARYNRVRRAACYSASAQIERARCTGVGQINADHDGYTQSDTQNHDGKLNGIPKQSSQGKHT